MAMQKERAVQIAYSRAAIPPSICGPGDANILKLVKLLKTRDDHH